MTPPPTAEMMTARITGKCCVITDEVKKLIAEALNLIFDFAKTHGYSEVSPKQVSMKKAA
jgi:hypothetical protein